jgi:hypothetical protein
MADAAKDPVRLPRIDWADRLTGNDEAHHVRQIIAQDAFGDEAWSDERVQTFFGDWLKRADGLISKYSAAGNSAAVDPTADFGALYTEMVPALGELCAHTLGVPPWVAVDLYRRFIAASSSRITGEDYWLRSAIEYEAPAACDYEATFTIRKGTPLEDCRRALTEFVCRVAIETGMIEDEKRTRRKPLPKHEGEDLARDARWYYRTTIRGEAISAIARTNGTTRQTVQHALKRIGPLIDVWTRPEPPRPSPRRARQRPRKDHRPASRR